MRNLILFFLLYLWSNSLCADTIYVALNANGGNNGTSWNNAFTSLHMALDSANAGDELWISNATFHPGNDRNAVFNMKPGVSLFGGFNGNESTIAQRNLVDNKTIISGEIGDSNELHDNCRRLLHIKDIRNPITIDGFSFQYSYSAKNVAAIFIEASSPHFEHCSFENLVNTGNISSGAAILVTSYQHGAEPWFTNCTFRKNLSANVGGAFHSDHVRNNTKFINCLFEENEAPHGAAIHNGGGIVNTINCTFTRNRGQTGPASVTVASGTTVHTHAIIWNNTATVSKAFLEGNGNTLANYSLVEGGFKGAGNISDNPQFRSVSQPFLRANSPAIDASNPSFDASNLPVVDAAGNPRVTFRRVDLGCYEYVCDSQDATTGSLDTTVCSSFTGPSGKTYTSTGKYMERLVNHNGCDSIITINLTIGRKENSITKVECGSFVLNGQRYDSSGTYDQILTAENGCDSILTIHLTINKVNTDVVQNGNTLTAQASNAQYQWVNCASDEIILGENRQSFTAEKDGEYACQITQNFCTEQSSCFNLTPSNVLEPTKGTVNLFPNPSTGNAHLSLHQKQQITLLNAYGQVVWSKTLEGGEHHLSLTELPTGIYYFKTDQQFIRWIVRR